MNYKIEYQDLSFMAYQQIKSMILREYIKPGEKIVQEDIAKQLGISRMPLHKAFQMLENELLVENKPRKGIYVKEVDLFELADAFECREAIEGIAVKRLATSITEEEVDKLYSFFEPFTKDTDNADLIKYQEADQQFHTMIINLCNNQILRKMEMLGNILFHTYRRGLIRPPSETLQEHFAIINSLRQRNGNESERLIREHFALSRRLVLEKINKKKSV